MVNPRLAQLSDITGPAKLPKYDPDAHGVGIVHLGLGAFHRAHQAAITDTAISEAGGDWRITGVSLRSRSVVDALDPQNGLYTLIERGEKGTEGRVIGSIARVIAADPQATLDALCAPNVRVVTLTVTEKGYGIDRQTFGPDLQHAAVVSDLKTPENPKGVLGLLTAALAKRRARSIEPFAVLSCDNLPDNGGLLRRGVIGFARVNTPELADWIAENVAFPSSMVDRITPAATTNTRQEATRLTGCEDAAAIETEPFSQWVIEDHFPQGRPAWEHGGAIFVSDVKPYEEMKLRMLNGAHSMLAYTGFLLGHRYVRDVMNDESMARLIRRHLAAAAAGLAPLPEVDFTEYARDLQERFRNPAIAHKTFQIAADATEKLPQRIFAPAFEALDAGRDIRPFAFATAAWMRYCLGKEKSGSPYILHDPRAAEITEATTGAQRTAQAISTALHELPSLFPEGLKNSRHWRNNVESVLNEILQNGIRSAVTKEAAMIE